MEQAELALCIAIVVVLVLLFNCWQPSGNKRRNNNYDDNYDDSYGDRYGMYDQGGCSGFESVNANIPYLPENQTSAGGSGAANREMKQRVADQSMPDPYSNYKDVAEAMALDQSVYDSHANYAESANQSTSGASALSERSDDNDVIPWIGLRRPDYKSVYAASDARVDHSEYADQKPEKTSNYKL